MTKKILSTDKHNWGQLIIRVTLGLVLFAHGAQKMLGLFGGYGFTATMDSLTSQMHLPWVMAFMVIVIEFFGAAFLIIGFASRVWSLAIIGLFTGIIFTTQIEHGFFMNWFGAQAGEGYEFSLLVLGLSTAILINGSGKYAIDTQLVKILNQS